MTAVTPSFLQGTITPPPSKSLSHRAVIAAALCKGTSILQNVGESKDIEASISAVRSLGAAVDKKGDKLVITGVSEIKIASIDCFESGSTLRFMLPVAAALGVTTTFLGQGKLPDRPYDELFFAMSVKGISFSRERGLPLTISGKLQHGKFFLRGDVSSQYITGLMFALPLLGGDSEIILTTPLESKAYVDLTLSVLNEFGIKISKSRDGYSVKGNQTYKPCNYKVESDFSSAAFFLAAGALNGDIILNNLNPNSLQGDREILNILTKMNADMTVLGSSVTVRKSKLIAADVDVSEIPDLAPILSVLLACAEGESRLYNGARLRIKESDRLLAIAENLAALGSDVIMGEDFVSIKGKKTLQGASVNGFNDHRIVMSMAIAACVCDFKVLISDSHAVEKSYPHFFSDYQSLGGSVNVVNNG